MAKFLTYEDRLEIQNGLKEHMTFTQIGEKLGRNYHDYEVYMEKYPDTAVVQMDSVIGSKGGKEI